jgi:hypothetical protein
MSPEEIKMMTEVLEAIKKQPKQHPPRMEFSKKLLIGVLFFSGLFCIISTVSWLTMGDWPKEIAEFFIWPFLGTISYMLKSAYENKAKIEGGRKHDP